MESSRKGTFPNYSLATSPPRTEQQRQCIFGDRMANITILKIASLLSIFFVLSGQAQADQLDCPQSISVKESLDQAAPASWSTNIDTAARYLAGVTFFDGPPTENMSISPTKDSPSSKKDRIAYWNFGANETQIWLSCRYLDTGISLSKPLPNKYKGCTVLYGPGGLVKSIKCN